jgi:gamma-glutamylcyclotransferase (GGCT)/AIG2-like uncharacterized protein YtfP
MILPSSFFVYGTLQRGQERAKFWPAPPLRIEPAYTLGRLHDLGPYPAMVEGPHRVLGELWTLGKSDLPVTLEVLDRVEGYNQGGHDWYVRKVIDCWTLDGGKRQAYSYFWGGRSDISSVPVIPPNGQSFCDWKEFKSRQITGSEHP